jgi:hypothetical protein
MIIVDMLMPVNLIVLHIQELYWHSMTAAFWPTQLYYVTGHDNFCN